ncbi:ethanolaminephosphotransferase 1 isoform X2 [Sitodiplosis mosellana]|nr:ethanolaminephosphotransferase 1 isoform X2 [Sitodiplosis mosellana]
MHPFWNSLVKFFPKWIAPNVVTFVGFLFTALNFIILSWYDWGFYASTGYENTTPVPNWFWLLAAINIFLAYTLDGVDGKLARRIGLSGPLGELFDHGLDSYTAPLIPSCLYSIFGRGSGSIPPIRMYFIVWMVLFNFFVSHFEKYNTGVLYLPWGYDFGMWGSTLMFLTTWFGTFEYWKRSLPFGIPLGLGLEFLLHASALSSVPMVVVNIYKSYKYKTGKMRSPLEAARPFFPFLTFLALFIFWIQKSPSNIMDVDTRAVFLLTGTIFSNVSCRLIVAQMSNTRCEAVHWMTPIYVVTLLISLYVPILERPLLYLLCIVTTGAHWHYGTKVVQQMCDHFGRECFTVTQKKVQKNGVKAN